MTAHDMSYSDAADIQHFGMPICKTAFNSMIANFAAQREQNPVFDIAYVTFSKASLFRILSQEQCDQVRFYFAFPEPGHLSLALEGRTKDNRPLNLQEIQNGNVAELFTDSSDDGEYEEKGNGGGTIVSNIRTVGLAYEELLQEGQLGFLDEDGDTQAKYKKLGVLLLQRINGVK